MNYYYYGKKWKKKKKWFVNISEYHHRTMGLLLSTFGLRFLSCEIDHMTYLKLKKMTDIWPSNSQAFSLKTFLKAFFCSLATVLKALHIRNVWKVFVSRSEKGAIHKNRIIKIQFTWFKTWKINPLDQPKVFSI